MIRLARSRRVRRTRRPQPLHSRPISAPRRTTTHSYEPQGWGLRKRNRSFRRKSGSIVNRAIPFWVSWVLRLYRAAFFIHGSHPAFNHSKSEMDLFKHRGFLPVSAGWKPKAFRAVQPVGFNRFSRTEAGIYPTGRRLASPADRLLSRAVLPTPHLGASRKMVRAKSRPGGRFSCFVRPLHKGRLACREMASTEERRLARTINFGRIFRWVLSQIDVK